MTAYTSSLTSTLKRDTLIDVAFPSKTLARQIALVIAFSLLVALSAQIVIPLSFTTVPVTGQTFAVLLTGALLGSRLGALALVAYLMEGALGAPFFRGGASGIAYLMMSETNGYLFAYPLAAYVTGYLSERGWDKNLVTAAAAMFLGSIVILLGGFVGLSRYVGAEMALAKGVVPFIIGDVIKIVIAAALLPLGWKLIGKHTEAR